MLALSLWPAAAQGAEELHDAARAGDQQRVSELLRSGRAVDEATRYGVTALFFACDRGHLEVVKLLLDAGADPARKDKFYGATPIDWALQNSHLQVAKLLLDRGSPGADQALTVAVRQGHSQLLESALASRQLTREGALEAAELARAEKDEELAASIESRAKTIDTPKTTYTADPAGLKSYVGSYRSDQGATARVWQQEERLHLQLGEQEARALLPLDEGFFEISGMENSRIRFGGRAGTVERVAVQISEETTWFFPHAEEESAADPPSRSVVETARLKPIGPGRNWPSFRGPAASGIGAGSAPPLEWDLETGKNVLWKTPLPGLATSSPIIWGDRIFVTTAISPDTELKTGLYGDVAPVEDLLEHEFVLIALDRERGRELWRKTAFRGKPLVKRHPKASQANSTPATDGRHVVGRGGEDLLHQRGRRSLRRQSRA